MQANDADKRKTRVQQLATQRLHGEAEHFASPLTVLASPMWRGIEADIWLARRGEQAEIFKHYHPDVAAWFHIPTAVQAAQAASACHVGPRVRQTWPQEGLLVMEYLGDAWQAGGLHHCADETVRANVITAKKRFQAQAVLFNDGNIFREIVQLHNDCLQADAPMPKNMAAYIEFAKQAGQAIGALGFDKVPCHRDGNTSNIMVGPNKNVMLIDFDMAVNADPLEDLGCWLLEFFEREPEMRQGFEEWWGHFHEGLFQRAVVYGILDDLRWGLIGLLMQASSPRQHLEFSKYAAWRLMRFSSMAQTAEAADRLRCMA